MKAVVLVRNGTPDRAFDTRSSGACGRSVRTPMHHMAAGFGFVHPNSLMFRSRSVIGLNMLRIADDRPETLARTLRAGAAAVESGEIEIVVGDAFPVEEIAAAHELLGSRRSVGKVAVRR